MLENILRRAPQGEDAPENPTGEVHDIPEGLVDDLLRYDASAAQNLGGVAAQTRRFLMEAGGWFRGYFLGEDNRGRNQVPGEAKPMPYRFSAPRRGFRRI